MFQYFYDPTFEPEIFGVLPEYVHKVQCPNSIKLYENDDKYFNIFQFSESDEYQVNIGFFNPRKRVFHLKGFYHLSQLRFITDLYKEGEGISMFEIMEVLNYFNFNHTMSFEPPLYRIILNNGILSFNILGNYRSYKLIVTNEGSIGNEIADKNNLFNILLNGFYLRFNKRVYQNTYGSKKIKRNPAHFQNSDIQNSQTGLEAK